VITAATPRPTAGPVVITAATPRPPASPAVIIAATPRPPASADVPEGNYVIAIDAGHSEKHPGAISATGRAEYLFNRDMAELVRAKLAMPTNVRPFLITSPTEMSLVERSRIATAKNAALFISIHHDSAQDKYLKTQEVGGKKQSYTDDDRFSGYSVFVSRKNPRYEESFAVARSIGRAMKSNGFKFAEHHEEAVRGENRLILDKETGVYAFDDLIVLKTATMPAVLVECGVIVNREEEEMLRSPDGQASIAAAIIRGIMDYLAKAPLPPVDTPKLPIKNAEPTPRNNPKPGTPLKFPPVHSSERPPGERR
jgi:N-acetylmuramoyl-L-alanine amidase